MISADCAKYFIWFLSLGGLVAPWLAVNMRSAIFIALLWFGSLVSNANRCFCSLIQGAWLGSAYTIEFLGHAAHLSTWSAGIALLGANTAALCYLIACYHPLVAEKRD
jgi:hypothetical protein